MSDKLFSVDILVCATAYVRADSREQARKIIRELSGEAIEEYDGAVCIDGNEGVDAPDEAVVIKIWPDEA